MAESGTRGRADFAFRVVVFLTVCILSSLHQTADGAVALRNHSPYAMVLVGPVVAGIVATIRGLSLRRTLHIHDRHVDVLLGIALLGAAIASTALFGPRMWWAQPVLRLDILARPLWVAAAFSALFGTRPLLEQLPSLGVLGATWPTPYILAAPLVPGGALAPLILAVILAAATGALLRERFFAQLGIAAVGAAAAFQWCRLAIATPWAAPAIGVAVPVVMAALLRRRWIFGKQRLADFDDSPQRAVSALSLRSMTPIVLIAAAATLIPSHSLAEITFATSTAPPKDCTSVPGWRLTGTEIYRSPLGHDAPATVTKRCRYLIPEGGTYRPIAVDVSGAAITTELGANPLPTLFAGPGRLDPVDRRVDIDGGKADVFDWTDPSVPTEILALSWYTRTDDPDRWQRVSLIVPDDKRASAVIPNPTGRYGEALRSLVDRVLTVLRTRRDQLHQYSVEPKDLALAKNLSNYLTQEWLRQ